MATILGDAPISYVKWDINRYMTEIGSVTLAAEQQQEVAHRCILGVYDLYERLTAAFPDVLFEFCASGGARFDPGMLHYAPQTWTSDNTDAVERLKIQYGTSLVYPIGSIGAHVSDIPNHQLGRKTSLDTRVNVVYFGVFGYELDVTKMTEQEKAQVNQQVAFYKENRSLIFNGQFYRIDSPFNKDGNVTSWMVVSEDQQEALVGRYQVLSLLNTGLKRVLLKGLNSDYEYGIEGLESTFFGDELMHAGLQIGLFPIEEQSADFSPQIFKLSRKNR